MKTDKIDALKLARSLRAEELRPIYIRKREDIDDRAVLRIRRTIQETTLWLQVQSSTYFIVTV